MKYDSDDDGENEEGDDGDEDCDDGNDDYLSDCILLLF